MVSSRVLVCFLILFLGAGGRRGLDGRVTSAAGGGVHNGRGGGIGQVADETGPSVFFKF